MTNVKSTISKHNQCLLKQTVLEPEPINVIAERQIATCICPLHQKCLTNNIVYKAKVKNSRYGVCFEYIGMTPNSFKRRDLETIESVKGTL